ncbi:nuclear transport factor 2 family protein [Actinomadura sp. DC4]|uniref:nuclear transport factor 2 family protein n=1 Tax=Actinomadura sp. DC4 TaxID=3055069 RepID=UPI0025B1BD2D|nr:nuclear transport factor 2 family protein [Actinomadura sp. DC4]MDN3359047.1 nuclear transport factor 2 family protein [Actinomadura sp. DC4]
MLDLGQLSDRIEIADLLTSYTRAVDLGEWDRLDAVFTPDAHIDYRATGGIEGTLPAVKAWLAEVLTAFVRRQHVMGQSEVVLDGDAAKVTAYFANPMISLGGDGGERLFACGGYYHHDLVRTGEGWRSRSLVQELTWTR